MKNLKTTFLELELQNEIKSNMPRIGKTKYLIQFFLEYTYLVILTFLTVYFHTFAPNSCEWVRFFKSFSFSIYGLTLQFLLIKHCSWIIWISYVLGLINTTLTFCGFHVSLPEAYWRGQRKFFDSANQAEGYLSAFWYAFLSIDPLQLVLYWRFSI